MARGNMIDSYYLRRTSKLGYTVIYLTESFYKESRANLSGFKLYDKFKISKSGQLIGYWGGSSGNAYKDFTGIYPRGKEILRVTKNYIIIK